VLRAYRRGHVAAAAERQLLAGRVPGVRTARVLATSRSDGLLALEHLPGQPLDVLLSSGTATPDLLRATGRALAQLHAASDQARVEPGPTSPASPLTRVAASARETAALVGQLCPALAGRVASVLQELATTAPAANEHVLCHGDFSADQVIIDADGQPGLIDWDRAGAADPAVDLAAARAAGLTADQLAELLDGYQLLRPVPENLNWHLAQAQLMRVADPFRSGLEAWSAQVEANVTAVEATLGEIREQRA
jgi:aminoglycoside phosphotransferase (APT) family kinase protein